MSYCIVRQGRWTGMELSVPEDELPLYLLDGDIAMSGSARALLASGEMLPPPSPAPVPEASYAWDAEQLRWRLVPTLEGLKSRQWEKIKARRNALETASTFQAAGSVFDSDPARIGGAVTGATAALSAGAPFELVWTLADNTSRALSAAEMVQVGLAQLAHIDSLHATARRLRTALAAAGTPEEAAAVVWPGNNPG